MNKTSKRILTADLLIADLVLKYDDSDAMREQVKKLGMKPGGKGRINRTEFEEFSGAVAGVPILTYPGGSSSNTLRTLGKLMGGSVQTNFIGVVGGGFYSSMIRGSLREAGIRIIPDDSERLDLKGAETAVSFVILYKNGERSIVTYPGNAAKFITPDLITDEMVKETDILFLQGNTREKFNASVPDKLLKLRWEHNKELWLALPTTQAFAISNRDYFQWLIASANVVMSNETEVQNIFGTRSLEDALRRMQVVFSDTKKSDLMKSREQIGFITAGKDGAFVVTAHEIGAVPAASDIKIVNSLGAGDTSYAGFMAGMITGRGPIESAELAMVLAAEKLKTDGPTIPNPRSALTKTVPHIAARLFGPDANPIPGTFLG